MRRSAPEAQLEQQLRILGYRPEVEVQFHPERKWRLDFLFRAERIAIEVEGVTYYTPRGRKYQLGRHQTRDGMQKDCEKYNALALMGFVLLRFTPDMIHSGEAVRTIEQALNQFAKRSA